jgi:hypothetical protein
MKAGIKKLLHNKKNIPVEVIEKCMLLYAERYNLIQTLSESMKRKEDKHILKFGKHTPQYLHSIELHAHIHFGKFLSIVTEQTGVTFKHNKKRTLIHSDQDFSQLAYSGVTEDF